MSISSPRWRVALAVMTFAVASAVVVLVTRDTTEAEPQFTFYPPVEALSCPAEDLKGVNHRELVKTSIGESTPEAAIQGFFVGEMPKLNVGAVTQLSLGPENAKFAFIDGGKTLATFDTVNFGKGWMFAGWSACESFLNRYMGTTSQRSLASHDLHTFALVYP